MAALRCEKARQLLLLTSLNLLDISLESGFSDIKYYHSGSGIRSGAGRDFKNRGCTSAGEDFDSSPAQSHALCQRTWQSLRQRVQPPLPCGAIGGACGALYASIVGLGASGTGDFVL